VATAPATGGAGRGLAAITVASEHPVPAHAVAECAGELLERGVGGADLLWVAAGTSLAGALADIVEALRALLTPRVTVAVVSAVLIGGSRVIDDGGGLCVLAVSGVPCAPLRLGPGETMEAALAAAGLDGGATVVVAADPFSVRPDDLAGPLAGRATVAGGLLAAGAVPGSNLMLLAGSGPEGAVEYRDGAVAVALAPSARVATRVVVPAAPAADTADDNSIDGFDGLPRHADGRRAVLGFVDLGRIMPAGSGVVDDVAVLAEWEAGLSGIGVAVELGPIRGAIAVLEGVTAVAVFG